MLHQKDIHKPRLDFIADSIAVEIFAFGLLFEELWGRCGVLTKVLYKTHAVEQCSAKSNRSFVLISVYDMNNGSCAYINTLQNCYWGISLYWIGVCTMIHHTLISMCWNGSLPWFYCWCVSNVQHKNFRALSRPRINETSWLLVLLVPYFWKLNVRQNYQTVIYSMYIALSQVLLLQIHNDMDWYIHGYFFLPILVSFLSSSRKMEMKLFLCVSFSNGFSPSRSRGSCETVLVSSVASA